MSDRCCDRFDLRTLITSFIDKPPWHEETGRVKNPNN